MQITPDGEETIWEWAGQLPALPADRDRSTLRPWVKAHPEDNVGMGRRGVFLDLNGTLVEPLKPERLDEMTLIPGVVEAVARLSAAGFVCPVVTVQSRIAKGLFSLREFEIWFASFAASLQMQGGPRCRALCLPSSLCRPVSLQETEYRTLRLCGS